MPIPNYDQWKTASPYNRDEEPEGEFMTDEEAAGFAEAEERAAREYDDYVKSVTQEEAA